MTTRLGILSLALLFIAAIAEARDWTDHSGRFHAAGDLLATRHGQVWIRRDSGIVCQIRFEELSAADQAFVRQATAAAELPAPAILSAPHPNADVARTAVAVQFRSNQLEPPAGNPAASQPADPFAPFEPRQPAGPQLPDDSNAQPDLSMPAEPSAPYDRVQPNDPSSPFDRMPPADSSPYPQPDTRGYQPLPEQARDRAMSGSSSDWWKRIYCGRHVTFQLIVRIGSDEASSTVRYPLREATPHGWICRLHLDALRYSHSTPEHLYWTPVDADSAITQWRIARLPECGHQFPVEAQIRGQWQRVDLAHESIPSVSRPASPSPATAPRETSPDGAPSQQPFPAPTYPAAQSHDAQPSRGRDALGHLSRMRERSAAERPGEGPQP